MIKLVNNMIDKINDKLNISVGSTLSNVLSALGVSVTNGQYQLFSIPTIPELEKGGVLKKGQVGLLEGKRLPRLLCLWSETPSGSAR